MINQIRELMRLPRDLDALPGIMVLCVRISLAFACSMRRMSSMLEFSASLASLLAEEKGSCLSCFLITSPDPS